MTKLPKIKSASGLREFTCFPAGILVFCINKKEELLLLSHPEKQNEWGIVSGAIEDKETILESALRESREEIGKNVQLKPIGIVHTWTFKYDEKVFPMISISYVMEYKGGQIVPGDDMKGSEYIWASALEIENGRYKIIVPYKQNWQFARAVKIYREFRNEKAILENIKT